MIDCCLTSSNKYFSYIHDQNKLKQILCKKNRCCCDGLLTNVSIVMSEMGDDRQGLTTYHQRPLLPNCGQFCFLHLWSVALSRRMMLIYITSQLKYVDFNCHFLLLTFILIFIFQMLDAILFSFGKKCKSSQKFYQATVTYTEYEL